MSVQVRVHKKSQYHAIHNFIPWTPFHYSQNLPNVWHRDYGVDFYNTRPSYFRLSKSGGLSMTYKEYKTTDNVDLKEFIKYLCTPFRHRFKGYQIACPKYLIQRNLERLQIFDLIDWEEKENILDKAAQTEFHKGNLSVNIYPSLKIRYTSSQRNWYIEDEFKFWKEVFKSGK